MKTPGPNKPTSVENGGYRLSGEQPLPAANSEINYGYREDNYIEKK